MIRSFFVVSAAVALAGLLAGCGGSQPPIGAPTFNAKPQRLPGQRTFHFVGKEQRFTVPAGVTSIAVIARGAGGGEAAYYETYSGRGGRVSAEIAVTPGETLYVFVGGTGVEDNGRYFGGYNGGGRPGYGIGGFGGGGASDVRQGGSKLSDRILVAGGGGGQGGYESGGGPGGRGGGLVGEAGTAGDYNHGGGGGDGGKQSSGGNGGDGARKSCYYCGRGHRGQNGGRGFGGHGGKGGSGASSDYGGGGGGGGGGYFGGGGGGGGQGGGGGGSGTAGGGGGGGSSYVEPNALKARMWRGWKNATGDGLVVFSW